MNDYERVELAARRVYSQITSSGRHQEIADAFERFADELVKLKRKQEISNNKDEGYEEIPF